MELTDTELKRVGPILPQCCAVNGNLKRCTNDAAWQGKEGNFIVYLCEKHAKSTGWPVGESMADDEE